MSSCQNQTGANYVVAISMKQRFLGDLQLASNVADVSLMIPYVFMGKGDEGSLGYPHKVAHFLAQASLFEPPPDVSEAMLRDITASYTEMVSVRDNYPEIVRALRGLDDLHLLPSKSDFEVLGLFAIVEMLITHNPKQKDIGDSITHQMKAKFPLLSKRFRRPLDYSMFGDVPEDTVWSLLYSYRSRLAHGGTVDFARGQLATLKKRETVIAFLRQAVRALIRHTFKEPQLLRDLKEC